MFLELHDGAVDCVETRDPRFPGYTHKDIGGKRLYMLPYERNEFGKFKLDMDKSMPLGSLVLGISAEEGFKMLLDGDPLFAVGEDTMVLYILLNDGQEVPAEFDPSVVDSLR